jgi:hypothetical protein
MTRAPTIDVIFDAGYYRIEMSSLRYYDLELWNRLVG